ncbi:hypothetical protein PV10_07032 [Exophiala mesophila]|uniref:RING-type domain-containing protein n=1 Tax=Exophiala mesophila TaxID=212818 RepID=A0A0D1XNF3_EXOME|nr:uncharacterized protein PV10_07032 [Exophiala mesophila]KIV89646.1 hypothetical protein PV10_07032 [Exophiala mesophila]
MASNDRVLRDARLVSSQRATSRAEFWANLKSNDILIRCLHDTMEQDDSLKAAIAAVVGKNSTPAQQSKLLLAIVAELAGGLDEILNVVARKVTQYHRKQNGVAGASDPFSREDKDEHVISINDDDDSNGYIKRNNNSNDDDSEDDTGDDYYDDNEPHASRSPSPAVKRESDALPAFSLRSLIEYDKRQNKRQPERPSPASFPMKMTDSTPPPVIGKRARSVAGDSLVGTPSVAGSATKKLKSGKDIVFAAALITFLGKVQTTHRTGQSIHDMLRCGKCNEWKRDARVLNCSHVYCHRCVQKLRIEAERGDALLGFRPYCIQPNCTEIVSGKTAVIFAEVMELLVWYDRQSPVVNNIDCKLYMLAKAKEKKPADNTIKNLLAEVSQSKTVAHMAGNAAEPCDLLEMARFARKWLIPERVFKDQ